MKRIMFLFYLTLILNQCNFDGTFLPTFIATVNYFPLSIGNSWIYTTLYDTTSTWEHVSEYKIFRGINIDSKVYYEYGINPGNQPLQIRRDALGRILIRIDNTDYVYFDFSLVDGDTYFFYPHPEINNDRFVVTVKKNVTVNVPVGNFTDCIELFFNIPEAVDDEIYYIFAPGVGIVKITGAKIYMSLDEYHLN